MTTIPTAQADILVAGSVAVDLSCDCHGTLESRLPRQHTSNPGTVRQSVGGVGYNVAMAAHLATTGGAGSIKSIESGELTKVKLCTLVGNDLAGATVLASMQESGLDVSGVKLLDSREYPDSRTAQYVAVNGADKELFTAVADMDVFTKLSFRSHWASVVEASKPKWLVVDANWSETELAAWIRVANQYRCRVAFEPVSVVKSARLFPKRLPGAGGPRASPRARVDLASPNERELAAMFRAAKAHGYLDGNDGPRGQRDLGCNLREALETLIPDCLIEDLHVMIPSLLPYIPTLLTKLGPRGVLLAKVLSPGDARLRDPASAPYVVPVSAPEPADRESSAAFGGVYVRLFPAVAQLGRGGNGGVVSVNGAGDTFLGVLVAGLAQGAAAESLVDVAQRASVLTLQSRESVSPEVAGLKDDLLENVRRGVAH